MTRRGTKFRIPNVRRLGRLGVIGRRAPDWMAPHLHEVTGRDYYRPTERGAERAAAQRLAALREVLRGEATRTDDRTD